MKNKLKTALDRELQGVHVSGSLRARILSEAEAGRFPQRRRRSILPPLAAAAAILMVVALTASMITLRRGGMNPPDPVVAQGSRGRVWICADDALYYHAQRNCGGSLCTETLSLGDAKAQGRTACPKCIRRPATPEPTEAVHETPAPTEELPELDPGATLAPTVTPMEAINESAEKAVEVDANIDKISVWTSEASSYYHRTQHCPIESADQQLTELECIELGKTPCTECFPAQDVWMTKGGIYFHTARNCSSMENAFPASRMDAVLSGKQECPVCIDGISVWTEPGDSTYHATESCSPMTNAKEISESEAILSGKTPCSDCFLDLWERHAGDGALDVHVTVAHPYLYVELQGSAQPAWIEQHMQYSLESPLDELLDDTFTQDMLETFHEKLSSGEVCGAAVTSYVVSDLGLSLQDTLIESSSFSLLCDFSTMEDGVQSHAYLLSYPDTLTPDTLYLELQARGQICTVSGKNHLAVQEHELPLLLESITLNGAPAQGEVSFSQHYGLGWMLRLSPLESAGAGMIGSTTFEDLGLCATWLSVGDARFVYFSQLDAPMISAQAVKQVDSEVVYDASDAIPEISVQFTDIQTGAPVEATLGDCMFNEGSVAYRLPDGVDLANVQVSLILNDESDPYEFPLS